MSKCIPFIAILSLFAPPAAAAQESDRIPVVTMAVEAVRAHYQSLFEGRVVRLDVGRVDDQSVRSLVASQLGLQETRSADALSCETADVSTCTLVGTDFILIVRDVRFEPGQARVVVALQADNGNERQPIWYEWWHLTLKQDQGQWTVVEMRLGEQT